MGQSGHEPAQASEDIFIHFTALVLDLCMSYGRAERGPLSRGGGLTHNNRAKLIMKSFHSEIYGSCCTDFQWKIKTPPCPTEKKNKQKAVYW